MLIPSLTVRQNSPVKPSDPRLFFAGNTWLLITHQRSTQIFYFSGVSFGTLYTCRNLSTSSVSPSLLARHSPQYSRQPSCFCEVNDNGPTSAPESVNRRFPACLFGRSSERFANFSHLFKELMFYFLFSSIVSPFCVLVLFFTSSSNCCGFSLLFFQLIKVES